MTRTSQKLSFPESQVETLWINAHLATMAESDVPYGLIENAAIAIHDGHIQWIGTMSELLNN